jgi:hypothetical protein
MLLCSSFLFSSAVGNTTAQTEPVVAINVSEYTADHWSNPSWTYLSIYRMFEEAFRAEGIPYVEVSDAEIESGVLITDGSPRYPILFCIATECVSDAEATQISSYAAAGGTVYVTASAWTRSSNGAARTDFALTSQMGLNCLYTPPSNWVAVTHIYRSLDSALVNHIPKNVNINWRLPQSDHTIPSLEVTDTEPHDVWAAKTIPSTPATVLLNTDGHVMLTKKSYGSGSFIYHSELAPLAGYSLYSPAAYEYKIIKGAIEQAFKNQDLPLVKLCAWPYPYDSAFVVRHDMDISYQTVSWLPESAAAEAALGVTGQYYIVTGDVRDAVNRAVLVTTLQQAQVLGAQIGSHNGGLDCSPWDTSLHYGDYLFYHWGPDYAMRELGISEGGEYSTDSIRLSFDDLQGWLGARPQIWVAPTGQGCWQETYQILDNLGIKTSGEFTTSPYPNFAFSFTNKTAYYNNYVVPFSRWITDSGITLQSIEDIEQLAPNDMPKLVDFYYDMGALVSPYSHSSSESGLTREFLEVALAKPNMWSATPMALRDWGILRQPVTYHPIYQASLGGDANITITLSGATSPDTTIEITLPTSLVEINSLQVLLNGAPTFNYRLTSDGLKIKAGVATTVKVLYSTGNSGGWMQTTQADFKAGALIALDADSVPGQLTLAPSSEVLFHDDFSSVSYTSSHWTVWSGSWTVRDGYYNMVSPPSQLSVTYTGETSWTNYAFETRVRYVSGAYSGEISARLTPISGSRYAFIVYPAAPEGPNHAALIAFSSWSDSVGVILDTATVTTDTNWHTLRMQLDGNRILCYYDGSLILDATDNNYPTGCVALESYEGSSAQYDYVDVSGTTYSSGTLVSSAFDGGATNVAWQTISWMALAPEGTSIQFRTRTAPNQSALASAPWSGPYTASGSQVSSPQNRWIQYEATLSTSDPAKTPLLYGVTITYLGIPDISPFFTLHINMTATVS